MIPNFHSSRVRRDSRQPLKQGVFFNLVGDMVQKARNNNPGFRLLEDMLNHDVFAESYQGKVHRDNKQLFELKIIEVFEKGLHTTSEKAQMAVKEKLKRITTEYIDAEKAQVPDYLKTALDGFVLNEQDIDAVIKELTQLKNSKIME